MGPEQSVDHASLGEPEHIGKYRLIELVGRGAMGRVYSAHDDDTDRQVAIKVLMTDLEGEPELRARFFREAQAAARLGHPNVITIYDVGEDDGRPFIVMELLRGSTLETMVRHGGLGDLETKVGLMIQLCHGMAAAHAAGIIHRDLKPGNLFVQVDGFLKVLDFGVARLASSSMTTAGAQPGTLQFMSPEQARGENIDERSDIFSAGGVFYYMLTGRKPFASAEWTGVLRMLQFEAPVALTPTDAPQELVGIVNRLLMKEPSARHQNFRSVAADLKKFQRHYEAETRVLLASVAVTCAAVLTMLASAQKAASLAGEAPPTSPTIDRLAEAHPILRERGPEALKAIPLTRKGAAALQEELARELARLAQSERASARLATHLQAGEQAMVEGDYHAGIRAFDQVLAISPGSPVARNGLTRCRAALSQRDAQANRVKLLVREAQAHARAESWQQVMAICDQILAIDRTVPLAIALREAARSATGFSGRDDDQTGASTAVRQRIHVARGLFRRGRHVEALADLRAFLVANPKTPAIELELERLTEIAAHRSSEAAAQADEMASRTGSTRALLEAGNLEAAVAAAREVVEFDPADKAGAFLLCEAIERAGAARIEKERENIALQRESAAGLVLAAARAALERGELVRAAEAAENAVRLSVSSVEAMDFLSRVRAVLSTDGSDDVFEDPSTSSSSQMSIPRASGQPMV